MLVDTIPVGLYSRKELNELFTAEFGQERNLDLTWEKSGQQQKMEDAFATKNFA